ncbi:DUF2513 domain-containing protein [Cyclobacterium amurskyense]|uniref:DUF2513 domain-containing protein n=1 Tax=Cyclobacterium amurskyense TaxID=320787 RepID=A0A0H4PV83_9BACT|nr:DUF2513 domain-containing protein [Cyclobacterium amurskyense]AKP52282.1 hypothetical protein CA2015_2875 [Cyclobacterium amurskyense]
MKRDLELIKKILLRMEEDTDPFKPKNTVFVENVEKHEFYYHLKLLWQGELIEAKVLNNNSGEYYYPTALTWEGHEFLGALKNDTAWAKLKKNVISKGTDVPFSVLKELLFSWIKVELM